MARKRRSSSRRTSRKTSSKKEARLVNNLVGIIVTLLMVIGLAGLGMLGTVIANFFGHYYRPLLFPVFYLLCPGPALEGAVGRWVFSGRPGVIDVVARLNGGAVKYPRQVCGRHLEQCRTGNL